MSHEECPFFTFCSLDDVLAASNSESVVVCSDTFSLFSVMMWICLTMFCPRLLLILWMQILIEGCGRFHWLRGYATWIFWNFLTAKPFRRYLFLEKFLCQSNNHPNIVDLVDVWNCRPPMFRTQASQSSFRPFLHRRISTAILLQCLLVSLIRSLFAV